ncbi:Uu.00g097230.m01.CDS01 [Anthostomella pinea]|uniref:Uu.00g097230.m01.CDS01 n=1 Tax=Anthostomella pinea TaxID=933095 RepID=A0AAI8VC93_9PEZI|nr:Uu.00g097230.m01.CDS01 [Anthostomella pinea]
MFSDLTVSSLKHVQNIVGFREIKKQGSLPAAAKGFSKQLCFDVRDHVYALRGVVEGGSRINVDYDISPQRLLLDTLDFLQYGVSYINYDDLIHLETALDLEPATILAEPSLREGVEAPKYNLPLWLKSYYEPCGQNGRSHDYPSCVKVHTHPRRSSTYCIKRLYYDNPTSGSCLSVREPRQSSQSDSLDPGTMFGLDILGFMAPGIRISLLIHNETVSLGYTLSPFDDMYIMPLLPEAERKPESVSNLSDRGTAPAVRPELIWPVTNADGPADRRVRKPQQLALLGQGDDLLYDISGSDDDGQVDESPSDEPAGGDGPIEPVVGIQTEIVMEDIVDDQSLPSRKRTRCP